MTLRYQIAAVLIMAAFYSVYMGKMILQRRQGIVTNQIGKDHSNQKRYRVEIFMKIATYSVIVVELISILIGKSLFRYSGKMIGIIIGILGDLFFLLAVLTMGNSWRAGVAAEDHRRFVHNGIFNISRNPAFVGFDLVYISILILFFNWFLLVFTLFPMVMLHLQILEEEKYLIVEFGEEYAEYKHKVCRYFGLKNLIFWLVVLVVVAAAGVIGINRINRNLEKLPDMTFTECLNYTTKGNLDAVITVGTIRDGQMSYHVYGTDGEELETKSHTYEIGSLTKTVTAYLILKAEEEGKLSLSDPIDKYLDLPEGTYPTIESLLTHTSGYDGYYLNPEMMMNGVIMGAPFRFVTERRILTEAAKHCPSKGKHEWNYSNFGYALLGLVLEQVYDDYYVALVNHNLQELGMQNSAFRSEQGDLGKCWKWELRDAYAPAGAIQSDIEDMLTYAQLQLTNDDFQKMHEPLCAINQKNEGYEQLGIQIDEIGMAWIVDDANDFVWHNGGTDDYNSYLGICKDTGTAVVILSNLPDDYRIPATVLGTKLLHEIQ